MMASHQFHPSILREYDIRGIYEKTLVNKDARAIGHCFPHFLGSKYNKTVVVGRDGRLSSPLIESFLVQGLQEAGVNVIRIGVGPTPLLYYAVHELKADGGIMITGSHNPSDYNGFKMMLRDRPLFGDDIRHFPTILEKSCMAETFGSARDVDIKEEYIQRLLKDYRPGKKLKIVWDAGNGSTGDILEQLVKKLPGQHTVLYSTIDGTFPHHHPDPTDEHTLEDIKRTVMKQKADIGIAFDGDGDRLGVIDNEGNVVGADHLLMLFARDLLRRQFGSLVIADVKTSEAVFEDIQSHGGKPLMWKTGHSFIKQKMQETGASLAGEMSGHFFFADHYYGFDDALYAAVRLLNIIDDLDCSLSMNLISLPSYSTSPEMRIQCGDERKFQVIKEIKERLEEEPGIEICSLDGIRVKTDKGWWLVRASNTQDMLVCRCEARKQEDLAELTKIVQNQLILSGLKI